MVTTKGTNSASLSVDDEAHTGACEAQARDSPVAVVARETLGHCRVARWADTHSARLRCCSTAMKLRCREAKCWRGHRCGQRHTISSPLCAFIAFSSVPQGRSVHGAALFTGQRRCAILYPIENQRRNRHAHPTHRSARRLVRAHWTGARWRPRLMIPLALACALVVVVCVAIGAFSKRRRKARLRE